MENKLPFKVVIKEASAGTGKTHSIMKEILNLKEKYGSYKVLKRIVAMTFSESAAIELKERLVEKIFNEDYIKIKEEKVKIEIQNILLNLNFSTIHSYARKILKRLSTYIEIDPFFKIIEENESKILFLEAISKVFSNPNNLNLFFELMKNLKINSFSKIIFTINKLHPYIFLGTPLFKDSITSKITEFYKDVEREYINLKKELGCLDFNDLEKLTYKTLTEFPEALLLQEDFDEKIDFIFVDEFQDTNLLQWEIIKKLGLEEWKSGYGAKFEEKEEYGIYIVGDKKQSIYKFRGGEKDVFEEAKKELEGYYELEKLKKNYRSTKEIIEFINSVFSEEDDWKGEELIFNEEIESIPSKIEINFFNNKEEEYEWVCNKILSLLNKKNIQILERKSNELRKIELKDFLILIRKRTENFEYLEKKLKDYNIPYVVMGGIGFYQESEIRFLLSLFHSLVDPTDKLSMWNIKNSIFKIEEDFIEKYRNQMSELEISFLIEKILDEINFWDNLSTQQLANVEKFLSILQNQSYLPIFQISKNFRELSFDTLEPKADIFSIHQNAVKIMTIHRAKGLEAPIVFLLNIEDINSKGGKNDIFYKREGNKYVYILKEESNKEFEDYFKKQLFEEEKRILYVALTRARQFLFISGINKDTTIIKMLSKFVEKYRGVFEKGEKLTFKESTTKKEKISIKFTPVLSFTKESKEIKRTYSDTLTGEIIHKIIYEIGTEKLAFNLEKIKERVKFYLYKYGGENMEYREKEIIKIFKEVQKNDEIKEIIEMPISEKVKSEYSFVFEMQGTIYEGIIDKIVIEDKKVKIYEFKTHLENLEIYIKQLEIYKNAMEKTFNNKNIECYIINLSGGKIIKIDNRKTNL